MDVVILPLVWHTTPVAEALEMLKDNKRAGVVRENPDGTYRLLFAGDLLRARATAKTLVEQVQGGRDILLMDAPMATSANVDLVRPHRTWQPWEHLLDARAVEYALIGANSEHVMLVTRHESLKDMLSTTGGFECTGTPTHFFPEPEVGVNMDCPLFPACQRTDGTTPKIQPA
jgi:hypothetical protein